MLPAMPTQVGTEYCIYRARGTKATRIVKAERFNGKFQKGYKINGKRVSGSTSTAEVSKIHAKSRAVAIQLNVIRRENEKEKIVN